MLFGLVGMNLTLCYDPKNLWQSGIYDVQWNAICRSRTAVTTTLTGCTAANLLILKLESSILQSLLEKNASEIYNRVYLHGVFVEGCGTLFAANLIQIIVIAGWFSATLG